MSASEAAAEGNEEEAPRATFASLPDFLKLRVLARLPVDARARAACVAAAWRTTTDDVSLWTRLDLSSTSGVTCTVNAAALRGAAAKARGGLTALDVSGCPALTERDTTALLAVVTANAGALRELRVCESGDDPLEYIARCLLKFDAAEALLLAAPLLHVCDLNTSCDPLAASRLLRREPPFGALSALNLYVDFGKITMLAERPAALEAILADVAANRSLRCLHLMAPLLQTPAALDALVDAALTSQLPGLALSMTLVLPASVAPALARLLGGSSLQTLQIRGVGSLLVEPGAAMLAAALRANSTSLTLHMCSLLDDGALAATLVDALTAHPSLRKLNISGNNCLAQAEVGAALGALIAANAPALRELNITFCKLDDAGMGPLMDALPFNTHLRKLDCFGNAFSEAFVRDQVLPAVRANTSLHSLPGFIMFRSGAAREVDTLVAARAAAARGAQ
jgi:hypothetical protein